MALIYPCEIFYYNTSQADWVSIGIGTYAICEYNNFNPTNWRGDVSVNTNYYWITDMLVNESDAIFVGYNPVAYYQSSAYPGPNLNQVMPYCANRISVPNTGWGVKILFNNGNYILHGGTYMEFYTSNNAKIGVLEYANPNFRTMQYNNETQYGVLGVSAGSIVDGKISSDAQVYFLACSTYYDGMYGLREKFGVIPSGVKQFFDMVEPRPVPGWDDDPYKPGGESEPGGGTGDFDGTSVPVDFAPLPTLSAVDAGLITLFNPTGAQLKALGAYLWSDLFSLDTLKKLFSDPMEAILGLSIIPGPVPQGSLTTVKFGNIDTGIYMTPASAQYFDVDCGSLNIEEYWGAYLDYEPYTKAEIYLPFIGVHQISVDDIMGKTVAIRYHIDILSGGCACEIKCGDSVLYTFVGCCATSVPVTGRDWTNLINGVISCGVAVGSLVATGGATAPAVAGEIASAATNSLKPTTEKSGSLSGAGGMLAGKKPVLMLTRPRQALPGNQNKYTGYPSFMTKSLDSLIGYTEIHSILLGGIDGTESEIAEIEELLKGGVIF